MREGGSGGGEGEREGRREGEGREGRDGCMGERMREENSLVLPLPMTTSYIEYLMVLLVVKEFPNFLGILLYRPPPPYSSSLSSLFLLFLLLLLLLVLLILLIPLFSVFSHSLYSSSSSSSSSPPPPPASPSPPLPPTPLQLLREMTKVMRECWYYTSTARPTAVYLKKKLLKMSHELEKMNYIEHDVCRST